MDNNIQMGIFNSESGSRIYFLLLLLDQRILDNHFFYLLSFEVAYPMALVDSIL